MDSSEINTWEEFLIIRLFLLLQNHIILVDEEGWGKLSCIQARQSRSSQY